MDRSSIENYNVSEDDTAAIQRDILHSILTPYTKLVIHVRKNPKTNHAFHPILINLFVFNRHYTHSSRLLPLHSIKF
jgi:hypothetical protein